MKKIIKILSIPIVLLLAVLIIAPVLIKKYKGGDTLNVAKGLIKQRLGLEVEMTNEEPNNPVNIEFNETILLDSLIKPFEEIGASLKEGGLSSNIITLRGVSSFDANGDGLQDLYFPQNGRPIARPVDENGVLKMDERVKAIPGSLYINQGNDAEGNPIFKTVAELQKNQTYVKEELLPENKFEPRTKTTDDPYREGRIGWGAVSADFNGDQKLDLLILNGHYGSPFTVPGFGLRFYPGADYIGRLDKKESDYIESHLPEFLMGDMKDGREQTYAGEPEGRNTLLINKGDKDNDGLPEWEDVTNEVGLFTNYHSTCATVADIDRDGDLDIYIGNFLDPDFWGFGSEKFAGNRNTLWINQLTESGTLTFEEKAKEYLVAGLFEDEPIAGWIPHPNDEVLEEPGKVFYKGKQIGENAAHTWAGLFTDINLDGFPDLIVANDIPNRAFAYINEKGKKFRYLEEFNEPKNIGCWMGIAAGDLNNDRKQEFMLGNCGGAAFSIRNTALFISSPNEINIQSICQLNATKEMGTINHMVFNFEGEKVSDITKDIKVKFNEYTAPDTYYKDNVHPNGHDIYEKFDFKGSINGTEFSWNPSFFDIDNDKDLDIYLVGALNRGNDNFIGDWSGGVGRMLINNSTPKEFSFDDRTMEYQLFDIQDIDYASNPPKRPAPGTGWHKENFIRFTDQDSYSGQGMEASKKSVIKDMFRMHEAANGNIATDLNQDGKMDIIVPHGGGYNSLSADARNLKVNFMGKDLAIPPPNKIIKAPTTFEYGKTFVYINKNETENNWVKIQLINNKNKSKNCYALGARIVINDEFERELTVGGKTANSVHEPIHIGLGKDELKKVTVYWPDNETEAQDFILDNAAKNKIVTLKRT